MDSEDLGGCFMLMVACLLFALGFSCGSAYTHTNMRKEAVQAGVAHWEVDQNGNTTFVFNKKDE